MALGIVQSRGAEARERWEGIDWRPGNKGKESIRLDSFGTKQSQIKKKSSVAIRVVLTDLTDCLKSLLNLHTHASSYYTKIEIIWVT